MRPRDGTRDALAAPVTLQWPPRATAHVRADGDTQEAPASEVRGVDATLRRDLLRPGDLLGGCYEVRDKLGEGGMGQVFEALDRPLAGGGAV